MQDFFCLWQLCPSEGWAWRWLAAWLAGTLVVPSVQGTWTASATGVVALSVFFQASCSWWSEGLFGQSFSVALPVQVFRGLPCPGVLLCHSIGQAHKGGSLAGVLICRSVLQVVKGAPWVGLYPVVQCVRSLMGQPLYCSAANAGVRGESMVMTPPPMRDSAVLPCFCGYLAFLHRHFAPQSPPSHPLNLSLCSQQQPPPWDCSTIPKLQLPAAVPSRSLVSLTGVGMAAVWFSFHLGCHRAAVSLSALNVSLLTQRIAAMWL